MVLEARRISKCRLLRCAVASRDRIAGWSPGDIDRGILDNHTVLNPKPSDLGEGTRRRTGISNKPRYNGELLRRVDRLGRTVKVLLAVAIRVVVAANWVADASCGAAFRSRASVLPRNCRRRARVRSERRRDGVALE